VRSTSASPCSPIAKALPVPTAMVLTLYPVAFSKSGINASSKPESWVLVVVARMILGLAGASASAAGSLFLAGVSAGSL